MALHEWGLYAILLIVWAYILFVLKRCKLTAFHYLVGTAGMFGFIFIPFRDILTKVCSFLLLSVMDIIGRLTGYFSVFQDYNLIFIDNHSSAISMYIDYECCGVIEILVFICLVTFFYAFSVLRKCVTMLLGTLYIMASNVLRLFVVSVFIFYKGNDYYYLAHAVIGRIVFVILTILLYFFVLSKGQLKKQNVGNFTYNS